MKNFFFQRSLKHQDIQGDIRHPVDYLVDLIETKVQSVVFLGGEVNEETCGFYGT